MRSKSVMLLMTTLATLASPLANADSRVTMESEVVRYDDLRLISSVGAAVLYGRLRVAADRVCGGPLDGKPIGEATRIRNCVANALAKAVVQVDEPLLTQYHESKLARTTPNHTTAPNNSSVAKTP